MSLKARVKDGVGWRSGLLFVFVQGCSGVRFRGAEYVLL